MFLQREIMSNRFLRILDAPTMWNVIEQLHGIGVTLHNVNVEFQLPAITTSDCGESLAFANAKALLLDDPLPR
jgi:hypothetical protein